MKQTGVVRKIDELGRIVLPKEIRRNLGIRDGENLEIFVEDNEIVLKKFSKMKDFKEIIENICKLVIDVYDLKLIVSDRDKVIFSNVSEVDVGFSLSSELINLIQNREVYKNKEIQVFKFNEIEKKGYYLIMPIITSIDCLGLVMIYSEEIINESFLNLLKLIVGIVVSKVDI